MDYVCGKKVVALPGPKKDIVTLIGPGSANTSNDESGILCGCG